MRTLEDEGHSVNRDKSVLEEVVEERNLLFAQFDYMIDHVDEFNIQFVTNPDDAYFIQFYDYLLKVEKKHSFMKDADELAEDATLDRVRGLISRLETVPAIQDHMVSALTPEEQAEIAETVSLIEEKQKVRKLGPIGKWLYNKKKTQK